MNNDEGKNAAAGVGSVVPNVDRAESAGDTGAGASELTDEGASEIAGEGASEVAGEVVGEVADEEADEVTDAVTDEIAEKVAGNVAGAVADEIDGAVAGEVTSAVAGEVAGGVAGAVVGALSGLHLKSSSTNENNKDTDKSLFICELNYSGICKGFIDPAIIDENLTHLYLTHNELREVPKAVIILKNIVKLDLSNNLIQYFNEKPTFITTLEEFSIANNSLVAPPLWLWKYSPKKLKYLNLSENENLVRTLIHERPTEYCHCWLSAYKIVIFNCRLHDFTDVLYTLTGVRELIFGSTVITAYRRNELYEFPSEYLYCLEAEIVNVSNCKIYEIKNSITSYSYVTHLDLSMNFITNLPEEFGDLTQLEVLIMSSNKLEALPESFTDLKKLRILLIANNRIEQLSENLLKELPVLKCLDLYENDLSTLPEGHENLEEFDFSQNFATEPEEPEYTHKRTELRNKYSTYSRADGKRIKTVCEDRDDDKESEYSDESDESPMEPPSADILPITGSGVINAPEDDWDV